METRSTLTYAIAALIDLEGIAFLTAAALHLGVPLPIGFEEPRILPAAIVEGLIGVLLAVAAFAILVGLGWAWTAAIWAHAVGVAGVLLGMVVLAAGQGPSTEANEIYHRVSLVVLAAVLVYLLTDSGKRALGRSPRRNSTLGFR